MSHRFRVWAPQVQSVDVEVGSRGHPMRLGEGGWFEADVDGAGPGSHYAFSLAGGPLRPDPRSHFQPHGVHGPSQVVGHDAFEWTDDEWQGVDLRSAVVYELHVGTFTATGTFVSAIEKLPHLRALGVDVVEVMPVAAFPGARGWGYDGVDLYAPHVAYGGVEGFKRFVDACHQAGIGVMLDVVYNHLGPSGNYLSEFGPYFSDRHVTPWGAAVNLDGPGSHEVRRFVIDNALHWLANYHLDGLRLDAVHAIVDTSPTHLLEELAAEVEALSDATGVARFLVAESEVDAPRLVTPRDAGGYGLDAQWNDDYHHALHAFLTGERSGYYEPFGSLDRLATELEGAGRPGVPAWRYVAYLQNHDQIGNRATGDRSSHLLSTAQLRVAAALVLLSPLVPMLFMGEEWGASTPFQYFTDHDDPSLGAAVSNGRRREFAAFGWKPDDVPDPQDVATFERSKLRWDELDREPHASLLSWHQWLIATRRSLPPSEGVRVRWSSDDRWLVMDRGSVVVAANLSDREQVVPVRASDVVVRPWDVTVQV